MTNLLLKTMSLVIFEYPHNAHKYLSATFFRNRYDTNQAQCEVIMTSAYFYIIIASKDDIYL